MKKTFGLPAFFAVLFFITSCGNPWPHVLAVDSETNQYKWFDGGPSPNEIYGYQNGESFCLALIDDTDGFQKINDVFSIAPTKFFDGKDSIPCIGYQKKKDAPWEIITVDGRLIVAAQDSISRFPVTVIAEGNTVRFVF